ncbi:MAG: zinc transporter ZupT [Bacilli bacterium]
MDFSLNTILLAFLLTLLAGLATGIGSIITLRKHKLNTQFLSFILGFSAGVMIYVSFVELFFVAKESLVKIYSISTANIIVTASFFCGILITALIDKIIPNDKNPHEINEVNKNELKNKNLLRTGVVTAFALALHNFPEGFATFASALKDPNLGISVAVAVAIHNIPEGIAVAVPIFYATNNRNKAFTYSFLSGLAEPLGAIVGFLFLMPFMNDTIFAIVFAGVAGMMVFVSLDELLPTAEKYGKHHYSIYGLVTGMFIMALSLIIV